MVSKKLAFGLTACPIDLIDQPLQDGPYIAVSVTEVEVGEPVQIDLKVTWTNDTPREDVLIAQSLGIYFCKSAMNMEPEAELCEDKPSTADLTSINILSGDSFEKAFSEIMIQKGQTVTLTHTFSFTSTQPIALYPVAFLAFPPGPGNYSGIYQGEQIAFKD